MLNIHPYYVLWNLNYEKKKFISYIIDMAKVRLSRQLAQNEVGIVLPANNISEH